LAVRHNYGIKEAGARTTNSTLYYYSYSASITSLDLPIFRIEVIRI
jgi:hypothetical protein